MKERKRGYLLNVLVVLFDHVDHCRVHRISRRRGFLSWSIPGVRSFAMLSSSQFVARDVIHIEGEHFAKVIELLRCGQIVPPEWMLREELVQRRAKKR